MGLRRVGPFDWTQGRCNEEWKDYVGEVGGVCVCMSFCITNGTDGFHQVL